MSAVVFVGPSIDRSEVAEQFDGEILAPIQRGDLERLTMGEQPPDRIGIVDGEFLQGLAVSPKEIMRVIERNEARFYGSSSMGALRATELAEFGMIGVGAIFEMFHSGQVNADDEVAMIYDQETLRPLSDPMVNIRVAVSAAVDRRLISTAVAESVLTTAKSLYFPDRSYPNILRLVAGEVPAAELDALRDFLSADAPNAKRDDAVALLRRMSADAAAARSKSPG